MKDIRVWILIFFLVRMYGIAFPPLEIGHNWRQTDGLMIARNFYEHGANLFFPHVDITNGGEGMAASEFPILNYVVYLFAKVFGYHDWIGRLVVLVTSCLGVYFFHRLIFIRFGEKVAFNAAIILTVSMWFSFSRKMMPDVFAASLAIIALYFGYRYLREGKLYAVGLFVLLGALACLSKILAASILTVMLFPMLDKTNPLSRKILIGMASTIILASVCYWYFFWVPYLQTLGVSGHFFMGYPYFEGMRLIFRDWIHVADRLFMSPIKYVGFVAFVTAIIITIRKKDWLPVWIFLVPMLAYLMVFMKTGTAITTGDNYYVLTMIPSMAFIIGYAMARLKWQKVALATLIIISIESIADQIYDFRIRQPLASLVSLEGIMDKVSNRDDLVAISAETGYPTPMYMAHRRGWVTTPELLQKEGYRNDIKQKGCKFIVVTKEMFGDFQLPLKQVHDSQYFRIYSFAEQAN